MPSASFSRAMPRLNDGMPRPLDSSSLSPGRFGQAKVVPLETWYGRTHNGSGLPRPTPWKSRLRFEPDYSAIRKHFHVMEYRHSSSESSSARGMRLPGSGCGNTDLPLYSGQYNGDPRETPVWPCFKSERRW